MQINPWRTTAVGWARLPVCGGAPQLARLGGAQPFHHPERTRRTQGRHHRGGLRARRFL